MVNSTVPEVDSKTAYAVIFGCIAVLGLPLNAVSLWILIRRHSCKSSSAVFMLNLAISDLLLVISLPMRVQYYATDSSSLGIRACTFTTMLFYNNIRSSLILITFISVDRLLAVVYPLRARHLRTTSNAWKSCAFVWLLILSINVPEGIAFSKNMNRCNSTCFKISLDCPDEYGKIMGVWLSIFALIMLAVNVVSTAMVCWTLRRSRSNSAKINKINVLLIFVMNLLMFIICFLPISLALLLGKPQAIMPALCLASMNCCLDPLLYYFSMDAFWKRKEDTQGPSTDKVYTQGPSSDFRCQI